MTASTPRTTPTTPRVPLGRRTRRAVLVLHVVSAGAWIGVEVLLGTLVGAAWLTDDVEVSGLAYQAIGLFIAGPLLVSGLACLATGLVLGLGTKYGLVRFWWVLVKLVLNLVLVTLVLVVLQPGMAEVAEHGRLLARGTDSGTDVSSLVFPPVVSLTALTLAVTLSVFKPWGRIRPAAMGPGARAAQDAAGERGVTASRARSSVS